MFDSKIYEIEYFKIIENTHFPNLQSLIHGKNLLLGNI